MNIIEKLGITPGPWMDGDDKRKKYRGSYHCGNRYKDIFGMVAVYSSSEESEHSGDEYEANKRLIFAAPEMLEALIETTIECMNEYSNTHVKGTGIKEAYNKEIGIIEKATGKTWEEIEELLNE